jgi:hypothetical protein
VHVQKWAHLDIAGVMESHGEVHYLSRGLSGLGNSPDGIASFPIYCSCRSSNKIVG